MRKNNKQRFLLAIFVVAALVFSGCAVRHGDFPVISNKMLRLSEFELEKTDRVKNIEGKDIAHTIIVFPTGVPTLEGALDDALEKGDGDVMTDAVVKSYGWYIPYIYGQSGWTVKGDVIKTRKN